MAVRSPVPMPDPERELTGTVGPQNPQLNQAAEQIGSALGRAVTKVREMPLRAGEIQSEVRDRLEVIRIRSQQQGAGTVSRLRDTAQRKIGQLKVRAQGNVEVARIRARRIARERPLQFMVVAFAAAFILGAVLRIGRSIRES